MDINQLRKIAKPLGEWSKDLNDEQITALLWARTVYSTYPTNSTERSRLELIAILIDKLDALEGKDKHDAS